MSRIIMPEPVNEIKKIYLELGPSAVYEAAAEEAVELTHELQKYARILRGENPTPKKSSDVRKNIIEEYTDLCICMDVLGLDINSYIYQHKVTRWVDRIYGASKE